MSRVRRVAAQLESADVLSRDLWTLLSADSILIIFDPLPLTLLIVPELLLLKFPGQGFLVTSRKI
jgi:hypothetical protein